MNGTLQALGLSFSLVAGTQVFTANAAAGADPVLVVVAVPSDAESVATIGAEYVQVECLFAPDAELVSSGYRACSERAYALRDFQLLFVPCKSISPSATFWCERLEATNLQGVTCRLPPSREQARDADVHLQRITDIHRALVSILPEHQPALDANLQAELYRLRMHAPRSLPVQEAFAARPTRQQANHGDSHD